MTRVDTAGRPRRTRAPEATRQALLDAATELFGTAGFDATSVQSIVERAQVTKGGFYHHFESKQALLHEIHERFIEYHLERMRELLAEPGVPAEDLLRRLIRDILVVGAVRWRNDIEIFYQERRQLEGERYAAVLRKRHEFEGHVLEVIQRGVAEGVLVDRGDPKVVAFGIIGMTMWAYHWFDPARGGEREVGELYAEMILDGLRA
jgi:AcrR family transcriptional regulator